MAWNAKSAAITNVKPKCWVVCERLDVVCVQLYPTFLAELASVIVACKYRFAPKTHFEATTYCGVLLGYAPKPLVIVSTTLDNAFLQSGFKRGFLTFQGERVGNPNLLFSFFSTWLCGVAVYTLIPRRTTFLKKPLISLRIKATSHKS